MKKTENRASNARLHDDINNILAALQKHYGDNCRVVSERHLPPRTSACAIFNVFNTLHPIYETDMKGNNILTPNVTFVLYTSAVNSDRVGSMAVYGTTLFALKNFLSVKKQLSGIRVNDVKLQMGRRLFLDITLHA